MPALNIKGRKTNLTHRLKALAGELEPTKLPFYVDRPGGHTPAPGWWWIPKGTRYPQYLGHNHINAEIQLRQLLNAQDKPL